MKTLYISDLDGTLLGKDALPSEFTVKTINELIEKGFHITFATARSISSAAKILPGFNLKLPAVMMNGVCLTDVKTKKQINVFSFEQRAAKEVIKAFEKNNRPPMQFTYDGDIAVYYKSVKSEYEKAFIEQRKNRYRCFERCDEFDTSKCTIYLTGIDEKEIIDAVCKDLEKIKGIGFSHYLDTYSDNKYFLEVYSEKAGKWNSIKILKEMYGFDRVVAFGDNRNDVEMLKNADVAIAVGNAQPEAKAVADIIIDTNENDGVAKYLLLEYEREVKNR